MAISALPTAWRVYLTLFVCLFLVGLSAARPLTAADIDTDIDTVTDIDTDTGGLLAILQPATDDAPAALKFYSPDARLVHEQPLPKDVAISGPALSPSGLYRAYLSGNVSGPDEPLQKDLTLHIVPSVDRTEIRAIPLLPPNFPRNVAINADLLLARDPTQDEFGDLEESTWTAFMHSLGIFAWSPDGRQLAFSAAINGPSSDLYLYDLAQGSVTRLTDGIEQIDGIRWSPDGQWIWHSTISYAFCQVCGGHHYAAAVDGSRVVTLPGSDVDRFLAWADGDSYLVTNQANGPGAFGLQLVDIPSGTSQMLWSGTHQAFVFEPATNRLGVMGTRGKSYDPDEQTFVVDIATGDIAEYDELAMALEDELWLAPLDWRIKSNTLTHPCTRPGPIVRPCLETIYDPLSPNGAYLVTADQAVEEVESGEQVLAPLAELVNGRTLWRPDSAGYFVSHKGKVTYRDLATGQITEGNPGIIVRWLPLAVAINFAVAAPTPSTESPTGSPTALPSTSTPESTPVPTPNISLPFRRSTLAGSVPDTASALRVAQAKELAALTQNILADPSAAGAAARASGLPLLLASEAVRTTLYPPFDLLPAPYVEPEAEAALDAALAAAPPLVAMFPASGSLPNLNSLALSPDGRIIATGHSDGSVRLWNYEDGSLLRMLPSATTGIKQLHFSSDGEMLAVTDQVGMIQMWRVASGTRSSAHVGRYGNTFATAWRPDTYDLAVANGSDPVMIHPFSKAAQPLVNAPAEALAYSPDGTTLAVALQPATLPLSATPSRQPYTPEERPIWIVDADTGEVLQELPDDRTTYFMAYTPDGETLVVGGGYLLRAWDLASASLRFETTLADFPNGWAMTPDGSQLAILTRRMGISFFDLSSGTTLRNLPVDANVLSQLAIHPLDESLISGEINGRPLLLESNSGAPEFRFGAPRARLVATNPANSVFATADLQTITLRDVQTQGVLRELRGALNNLSDLTFSADGKWLAAREEQGYLLLWEVASGELQWRVLVRDEWRANVAFTTEGRLVTGGSAGILTLVDPANGTTIDQMTLDDQIVALAVSSHNEIALIVGAPNGVALRVALSDAGDRLESSSLQTLPGAETVRGRLAYSADGTLLALVRGIGSNVLEASLEIWDTESNRAVQTIALGNVYTLNTLAFSPDGSSIASGAFDNHPITLWDVSSGEPLQRLGAAGSTRTSTRVAFTADGTQLLVSGESAITALYTLVESQITSPDNTSIEAKLLRAEARIPRAPAEFTAAERRLYAIDTFVGAYPLSASGNVNLRLEPYVKSLVVQPTSPETLVALTNEDFLLTSVDQGESWRIVTRLPLTLTTHSLSIPARASDPLLITTDQGLYRLDDSGKLSLLHNERLIGVSYSHTNPNELWAVGHNKVYKSEDKGTTWGEASSNLLTSRLHFPLLIAQPNNNPQLLGGTIADAPARVIWRGTGNGFWEPLLGVPPLSLYLTDEQGLAWDASNRVLYLGGEGGELFAVQNVDAANANEISAIIQEQFGPGTRLIPLAVGSNSTLYGTLLTSYAPKFLRGEWDGTQWLWVELRLPLVAAG